jgi:hypothetical protein
MQYTPYSPKIGIGLNGFDLDPASGGPLSAIRRS